MVTSAPCSRSFLVKWKPMNPAPPVTKIFLSLMLCAMKLTISLYLYWTSVNVYVEVECYKSF